MSKYEEERDNLITERDIMLSEHKHGLAALAKILAAIQPTFTDPFCEALVGYIVNGPASVTAWHLLPNLAQYEQLKLKDEWDEEAINLASRADIPWQILIDWFGNQAAVWQAVELSADEILENWELLQDAGVNLEPYRAKLDACRS